MTHLDFKKSPSLPQQIHNHLQMTGIYMILCSLLSKIQRKSRRIVFFSDPPPVKKPTAGLATQSFNPRSP